MDKLSALLERHAFHSKVFYNGDFCGSNSFEEEGTFGHLHIARRGQLVMQHEDQSYLKVEEPTIILYARGLNHRLCVPPEASTRLLCARISFEEGKRSALSKALPEYLQIPLKEMPHLGGLLEMVFCEADAKHPGQQLTLDRLCDVIIIQIIRYAHETGRLDQATLSGLSDLSLARALIKIHNDPAHPWSLQQLAEICGMSRSKFAKCFHQVLETTPANYLTERRMLLAQTLLKKNRPVKAVAVEVGYASQPAFTKAFTAKLGMSPRDWLRNN